MAIGQGIFAGYRNELIDYLPPMYVYEFIMKSKRPDPLATFATIVYPFDIYIWTFMIISMILQFLMLIAMQKIWSSLSGNFSLNNFVQQLYMI